MKEFKIIQLKDLQKQPRMHKGRLSSDFFEGTNEELYLAYLRYRLLFEFGVIVLSETQIDRIIDVLLDKLLALIQAERCLILLFDEQGHAIYQVGRNLNQQDIDDALFEVSWSIIHTVQRDKKCCCIPNALESPEFSKSKSVFRLKILSVMCVPVIHHENLIGVLYADNRSLTGIFNEASFTLCQQFVELVSGPLAAALHRKKLENHLADLQINRKYHAIIGASPVIQEVLRFIDQVADTNATVLIEGESGTGKELVARALHENSRRRDKPFVSLNCGALTETLLESELFGHIKGAFTGAISSKKGWFETADGGTIFFDEISEMSPALQVKLLRILQTGEFSPVGSRDLLTCDVRIIAATNSNLEKRVKEGAFRSDLYYRLNILYIHLPELRQRGSDILLLAYYFLKYFGEKNNKSGLSFNPAVEDMLLRYPYPGNVRELENAIQHAVVLARGEEILPMHLPESFRSVFSTENRPVKNFAQTKRQVLESFEREYFRQVLQAARGVVSQAARMAGMDGKNFYQKMEKYGIDPAEFKKKK